MQRRIILAVLYFLTAIASLPLPYFVGSTVANWSYTRVTEDTFAIAVFYLTGLGVIAIAALMFISVGIFALWWRGYIYLGFVDDWLEGRW